MRSLSILLLLAAPCLAQQDNSNHSNDNSNNLTFQIGSPSSTTIVDKNGSVVKIVVTPSMEFAELHEKVEACKTAVNGALPALEYYLNRFPAATANQEWRPGIQGAAESLSELKQLLDATDPPTPP